MRRLRPSIVNRDANQNVLGALLRVLHEHVEVAVGVEHAGVEQLVLEILARTVPVRLDEVPVREIRSAGYLCRYFMYEWVGVLSR